MDKHLQWFFSYDANEVLLKKIKAILLNPPREVEKIIYSEEKGLEGILFLQNPLSEVEVISLLGRTPRVIYQRSLSDETFNSYKLIKGVICYENKETNKAEYHQPLNVKFRGSPQVDKIAHSK